MNQDNSKWIAQLNYAYDLDCGGYSFEEPPKALMGFGAFVWDDPDPDTVPWIAGECYARDRFYGLSCPVYVFAPNSGHFLATEWKERYVDGEYTYRLVDHGQLLGSDHDCHCHGQWVSDGPGKQKWEFTGNTMDKALQDCERCEGSGYVDSVGGEWALYAIDE